MAICGTTPGAIAGTSSKRRTPCKTHSEIATNHAGGGGGSTRPWLFRVVRNRLIDLHRRSRRERPNDILPALAVDADDPAVDTEAIAALNQLPPRQREAMVLRFRGGLSYDAIAEVMGTSHSNVGCCCTKRSAPPKRT